MTIIGIAGTPSYQFAGSQTGVASAGTADFTISSDVATGAVGFLVVYSVRADNGNITTMTTYSLFANGITTGIVTQTATATGSGGACAFDVTVNSNNPIVIRVTNNSDETANIQVAFFGVQGGLI
jgi:hypothetical protein